MITPDKEMAIQKIKEMPTERVSKVLIFMAGMEAEHIIDKECKGETSVIPQSIGVQYNGGGN